MTNRKFISGGTDADIIFADRNLDIKRVFTGGSEIWYGD